MNFDHKFVCPGSGQVLRRQDTVIVSAREDSRLRRARCPECGKRVGLTKNHRFHNHLQESVVVEKTDIV